MVVRVVQGPGHRKMTIRPKDAAVCGDREIYQKALPYIDPLVDVQVSAAHNSGCHKITRNNNHFFSIYMCMHMLVSMF